MTFWKAEFVTPNFEFEAYGKTEQEARTALEQGWKVHCRQFDRERALDPGYFQQKDVNCFQVSIGAAYRDHETIKLPDIKEKRQ